MHNYIIVCSFLITALCSYFNSAAQLPIWEHLQAHCGEAFEGELMHPTQEKEFSGKKLVMHIRSCNDSTIYIPFFVGENKSRTWILRKQEKGYSLHHDHRHEDGSPEEQTLYGGFTPNAGFDSLYMFPADDYTCDLIPFACGNIWWITMNESYFTYNLRRIGTDRLFSIRFDLSKRIKNPPQAWGYEE